MTITARLRDDTGETLIEILMTIVILGICAVAIGAGMAISVKTSDMHRKQALAGEYLHNYAEALQSSSVYQPCSGSNVPDYTGQALSVAGTPANSGPWQPLKQTGFAYWNGSAFVGGNCPSQDPGLQEITLNLRTADGLASESVVVVLRSPS